MNSVKVEIQNEKGNWCTWNLLNCEKKSEGENPSLCLFFRFYFMQVLQQNA